MHPRPFRKIMVAAAATIGLTAPLVMPTGSSAESSLTAASADGYWMVDIDGRVYEFGDAQDFEDSTGTAPVVKLAPNPAGEGYWVLREDGSVSARGEAADLGSATIPDGQIAATMAPTPSGQGYWIFTDFGWVFPFGDAGDFGDTRDFVLNDRVVDSVATPTGLGYYMVALDGGVFAFGDAQFAGSMGGVTLNRPVNGLVPDPDGEGYWLVADDGGVFAFDAAFVGSMGGSVLNRPVIGMVAYGNGYLMVASDGGIFKFSDLAFFGSLGGQDIPAAIAGVAVSTADDTPPTTTTTEAVTPSTTTTVPPTTTTTIPNPSRSSVDSASAESDGRSFEAAINADGRYVLFRSTATNLDGDDNNNTATDIYRHDHTTGETIRVSARDGADRQAGNGPSRDAAVTADGNVVVFASTATNLIEVIDEVGARDNDIFVRDIAGGTTVRITNAATGGETDGVSDNPDISADGRYVVFASDATNLVDGDTNGVRDIFLHDRSTGTTTRLTDGNGASDQPRIASDGAYAVFTSAATDLVDGDTNGVSDVFRVSLQNGGGIERVSISELGEGADLSDQPDISADGNIVVFATRSALVEDDKNRAPDIYVKDMTTGEIVVASVDAIGAQTQGPKFAPSVSDDGTRVAFHTTSSDFVTDANDARDVFVRDLTAGTTTLVSESLSGSVANGESQDAAISGDGSVVAFQSDATDLVVDDTNGEIDVFRFDMNG